jgi:exocyst complex component 1
MVADVSVVESYITHIRIIEDSVYQATPPPPNSDRQNKKERVIVLAVRSTGRIQVHKARENTTGTFSVGKVWEFADLSAIGSFSTRDAENEQVIQWADAGGFTVTLKKPYYWQASSPKEKEFFIASLLKIYKKYTQGELPKLTGFSAAELEKVLGESGQQSRGPPSNVSSGPIQRGRSPLNPGGIPPSRPTPSPDSAFAQPRPSPPATKQPPPGSRGLPFTGQDRNFENRRPSGPDQRAPQGYQVPPDALRPGQLRQPPSREQIRPYPGQTPPDRLTPQSSQSDFAPNRTGTPDSLQIGAANRRGGVFQGRPDGIRSRDASPSNALGISGGTPETRRLNGNLGTRG